MTGILIASGVVWTALLLILLPCAYRTAWRGQATPLDKVLTVVFFLTINRISFNLVRQFAPQDQSALALCQVVGAMAGLVMCFVARAAIKASRRG